MATTLKYVCLLFILLGFVEISVAQPTKINAKDVIAAWKTTDTSQSRQYLRISSAINALSEREKDAILQEVHLYLQRKYDGHLYVRTMLYKEPWWLIVNQKGGSQDKGIGEIDKVVRVAMQTNDDQLLSDVFAAYAEHCNRLYETEKFLFYSTQAIEINKRISPKLFPDYYDRIFNMCKSLYLTKEYKQSILYGLEVYRAKPRNIFTIDLVGASYRHIGMYDSSIYYYKILLDALPSNMDVENAKMWQTIANGEIGFNLAWQNKFSEAIPILLEYERKSELMVNVLNIALARQGLAMSYFKLGRFNQALPLWKWVYEWSRQTGSPVDYDFTAEASEGISWIYNAQGLRDSSIRYTQLFHQYTDSVYAYKYRNDLGVVQARIGLNAIKASLEKNKEEIKQETMLRNFILVAVVLIAILAILLYNKKRGEQRYRLLEMETKNELIRREMEEARERVAQFTNNIIEKNALISDLETKIENHSKESNDIENIEEPAEIPIHLLKHTLLTEEQWESFRQEFGQAYPLFFKKLHLAAPKLTPALERLSALIFLRLTNFQIANTLGISKDSVARSKRRLRNSFEIPMEQSVEDYISTLV